MRVRLFLVLGLLCPLSASAGVDDVFTSVLLQAAQTQIRPVVTIVGGGDPGTFNADPGEFVVGVPDAAALTNLSGQIAGQFQRFPVGSSVAAFTFEFDPELNVFTRSTEGLGPQLSERAQTTGRGKINVAFAYSHIEFSVFEGDDIDEINLGEYGRPVSIQGASSPNQSTINYQGGGTLLDFNADLSLGEGQVIPFVDSGGGTISAPGLIGVHTAAFNQGFVTLPNIRVLLDAELEVDVFAFFLNYGVTDWLDVGAVVPLLNVDASGRVTALGLTDPNTGAPLGPVSSPRQRDNSFGFGDITLRSKARLLTSEFVDAAVRADLTLPTGDEDELRGYGDPAFGATAIFSKTFGMFSPHANAGLQFRTDDPDFHAGRWAAGLDFQPHELITFTTDVIGEHLLNRGEDVGRDVYAFSGGLKLAPWRRLVIAANVVVRLNDDGLRADYIPSGTIEYTFR